MASRNVRVLKRKQFTIPEYNTQTYNTTLPIESNIDISPFKEAVVVARLHNAVWGAAEYVEFVFKEDGYTDEDPTLTFTGNTLNAAASLKFSQGEDFPAMKTVSLTVTYPLPPMIKVELQVSHGSNSDDMVVDLSLDIVLRD